MKPTLGNSFDAHETLLSPEPLQVFEDLIALQEGFESGEVTAETIQEMKRVLESLRPYLDSGNLPESVGQLTKQERTQFFQYLQQTTSLRLFLAQQGSLDEYISILDTMSSLELQLNDVLENSSATQQQNIQTLVTVLTDKKNQIHQFLSTFQYTNADDPYLSMLKGVLENSILSRISSYQRDLGEIINTLAANEDVGGQLKDLARNEIERRTGVDIEIEGEKKGRTISFGIQRGRMTIDRSQAFPGENQDRLLDQIVEGGPLRQALDLIFGEFEGEYTRTQTTSVVNQQREVSLGSLGVGTGNRRYLLEGHTGVEMSTALLSQTGGLSNPNNLSLIIPGGQEFFAIRDILSDGINGTSPNAREQRSISIYAGGSLSLQNQTSLGQLTHTIGADGKVVLDETFTAGTEFFDGTDVLDRVGLISQPAADFLQDQLTQFPGQYLVLGIPMAAGGSVNYQVKLVPLNSQGELSKVVELALGAEYEMLRGRGFNTSSISVLGGVNINLGQIFRKKERD